MKKKPRGFHREMISFIVSCYDRPAHLTACLASLAVQTEPHELIVCCNGPSEKAQNAHREAAEMFGARFYNSDKWGAYCGYSSAEIAIEKGLCKGDWLCFPSDDSLYVSCFSDLMMRTQREQSLDLVYCDCVYDPFNRIERGMARYGILNTEPKFGRIDKTTFIMRKDLFNGFPGKRSGGPTGSDGLLVEELLQRGVRHGKAPGVLAVHQ